MSRLIDSAPATEAVAPRTDVVRRPVPVRRRPARRPATAARGGTPTIKPAGTLTAEPAGTLTAGTLTTEPGDAPTTGHRLGTERRTVTVLFVDIVGFTGMCGERDPEDVRTLQIAYFEAVRQVVRRWRGVVEKYVGDAVLAVFGAPVSDGYDAYRAVRAGLEIHPALAALSLPDGSVIRARIGVATGEAIVDLDAVRDGGQALVSGDVVNTASRLQAHAGPGTVVVTAGTRRATATLLRYDDLPPVTVAGKPAALGIWRARGPRPPQSAPHRDRAPLVGRDPELTVLTGALTTALRDRVPRLIPVTGPAGIGKSRVVREAAGRVREALDAPVRWWVGHCPPYPRDAFEPFAEMLLTHAGVGDDDQPATAQQRLADALTELVGPAEVSAALAAVAGGPQDDRVWRRVLLAAAARQPLVLVLEDLQHAPAGTARFVQDLVAAAVDARLPLAVVGTWRTAPEDTPADPGLRLRPLTGAQTDELLRHLLSGYRPAAALVGPLRSLAAGNPWYAEEYVHLITEAGTGSADGADLPTPEPVRRVLSAHLDRVDPTDREVLRAAAVLGEVIRPAAVAALLGADLRHTHAALRRLHRGELLVRRSDRSTADLVAWAFADPVLRRVAYERLPRAVRAGYHRCAAEWLGTASDPHRSTLDVERARHWLAAFELTRALHGDAVPCLLGAVDALVAAGCGAMRAAPAGRVGGCRHGLVHSGGGQGGAAPIAADPG